MLAWKLRTAMNFLFDAAMASFGLVKGLRRAAASAIFERAHSDGALCESALVGGAVVASAASVAGGSEGLQAASAQSANSARQETAGWMRVDMRGSGARVVHQINVNGTFKPAKHGRRPADTP